VVRLQDDDMTDYIDRYLDGVPDNGTLTPEERAQAETLKRVIDETWAFTNARRAPDFTDAVMRQIERDDLHPWVPTRWNALRRAAAVLWAAREVTFTLRPAYVMAAAAALVLFVAYLPLRQAPDDPARAAVAAQPQLFVQFRLEAADASDVRIAGSFTGWEARHQLHQAAPGIWTITLPLTHGVHDYAFIVDGNRWVPDPYAQQVNDGFGGINSRIALLPPDPPQT
jgi:hypothetical protein